MKALETGVIITQILKTGQRPEYIYQDAKYESIGILSDEDFNEYMMRLTGKFGATAKTIIDRIAQVVNILRSAKINRSKLFLTIAKVAATLIGIFVPSLAVVVNSDVVQGVYEGLKKEGVI